MKKLSVEKLDCSSVMLQECYWMTSWMTFYHLFQQSRGATKAEKHGNSKGRRKSGDSLVLVKSISENKRRKKSAEEYDQRMDFYMVVPLTNLHVSFKKFGIFTRKMLLILVNLIA